MVAAMVAVIPICVMDGHCSVVPVLSFVVCVLMPVFFLSNVDAVEGSVTCPVVLLTFVVLLQREGGCLSIVPIVVSLKFRGSTVVTLTVLPLTFVAFGEEATFFF